MKNKITFLSILATLMLVGCSNTTSSSVASNNSSTSSSVATSTASSQTNSSQTVSSQTISSQSNSSQAASSTSVVTAPTAISLKADKTTLDRTKSAIVTLEVTGGNETIVPELSDKSTCDAQLVKNQDGTYTLALSQNATFGGWAIVTATSSVDPSISSTLEVKFTSSVSENHQKYLDRSFTTLDEGSVGFDGKTTPTKASVSFAKDASNVYTMSLVLNDQTYSYFSVYDSIYNEIRFAASPYFTSEKEKSLNFLQVKLFDLKVELYTGSLNMVFSTTTEIPSPFDATSVSFKSGGAEIDETTVYNKKVGDKVMLGISHNKTTDKMTYSFEATKGKDYVTKAPQTTEQAATFTILDTANNQDIEIKATVTCGTTVLSKTMKIHVESQNYTFCEDLIGTWQYTDYQEVCYTLTIKNDKSISLTVADDFDEPEESYTFTATNIQVTSDTAVTCKLTTTDTVELGDIEDGEEVEIEYDEDSGNVRFTSENIDYEEFEAVL